MSQGLLSLVLGQHTTTRDAFLGGRVFVSQPKAGFRAGLDSVLLAASVAPRASSILDLGAGAGIAAICALVDLADARATLLDHQKDMLDLAAKNISLNALSMRAEILCLDVTARGSDLFAGGLKRDYYDSVIANPPFFATGSGTLSPDEVRAGARHMPPGELDSWIKTAATSVAPGGEVIFIHMAQALPQLLAGFTRRFGSITVLPVVARPAQPATRILIRGKKGSRAPMSLLSPLVLHQNTGPAFLPEIDAIFRGKSRLDW